MVNQAKVSLPGVDDIREQLGTDLPYAFGLGVQRRTADFDHDQADGDFWFPEVALVENDPTLFSLVYNALDDAEKERVLEGRTLELDERIIHKAREPFRSASADDRFGPDQVRRNKEVSRLLTRLGEASKRDGLHQKTPVLQVIGSPDAGLGEGLSSAHADAFFRLHLLSHREVEPNTLNLDGIFGALPNMAWTNYGPIRPEQLDDLRFQLRNSAGAQELVVYGVDKFPRMVDYVNPKGVRIADADRVRLGAYLGEGTTVMHEGFVNFNAGTLGKSMVEGRISAHVVVGDQTDIGGGASIMGTLSGGGKEKVKLGRGNLLGANSGLGISLGDLCRVEAGLYVTSGMPVAIYDKDENPANSNGVRVSPGNNYAKARHLSGVNNALFLRDSGDGSVRCYLGRPNPITLNEALHSSQ